MGMTLGDRIKKVRGKTARDAFAAPLGCSGQAVAQWEVNKTRPTIDRLSKIAEVYNVDYNWLATGVGGAEPPPLLMPAPLIGWISAGSWCEAVESPEMLVPRTRGGPNCFALRVEGNSMNRIAPDGEIIIVDPDDKYLIDGKFYIIRNGDADASFKRYRASEGPARFEPHTYEDGHKTYYFGHDDIEVIGRVIWHGADM